MASKNPCCPRQAVTCCWTILRRCYDCGNYDRTREKCGVTQAAKVLRTM